MLEPTDMTRRTELMSRESNGLTVRLLWSRATNLVTVAVADAASDDYFELGAAMSTEACGPRKLRARVGACGCGVERVPVERDGIGAHCCIGFGDLL